MTTVREPFSPQFPFRKGSNQWRVSPSQCWRLSQLEFGRHLWPCVGKSFSCWCCCVTGFQESYCYQLPGITLPVPVREWAERQTTFAMLEERTLALVQCLASPANWMGIRAASQSTVITSTEQRAHAGVKQRPQWEIHSLHSFHFCKGSNQWRVSPSQCWRLSQLEFGRHLWPCVGKSFSCWCCCVTGFQESYCYQLPGITLPLPVRQWAEHQTTFAMLEERTFALVQCLGSPANWMGIRAAIQSTVITSTKQRAHAGVKQWPLWEIHSLHSFHLRKGSDQRRVSPSQSWKLRKLEFGRHLRPCVGKSFSFDAAVWQLPATRNHVAFSGSRLSRASNNFCHAGRTKICPRSKSCQSCPLNGHSCSNPVHSNHQYRTESTHASVQQWPPWESHSLHSFHFAKGQINEECLLRNFEKAWAWQTPQTLCQEDSLVADDVFWRLPGIQSLPGITFPVPVPGKNEPSIKQLLPCWKNKNLPSFKVLPVLPIEWAFVQQSSPQ